MKRFFVVSTAIAVLAAGSSYAETDQSKKHEQMHEMMMKKGGPKPDTRIELKVPSPMKVMQKQMMREHLSTVAEITAALAANDLDKAAATAKEKLGWNQEEEKRCATVADISGEKDFVPLGRAVHLKADELAEAAKAGDRDKALSRLSEMIVNCNSCHARYRH